MVLDKLLFKFFVGSRLNQELEAATRRTDAETGEMRAKLAANQLTLEGLQKENRGLVDRLRDLTACLQEKEDIIETYEKARKSPEERDSQE